MRNNVVRVEDWPVHHRVGLEQALIARRRHNRRRLSFKWGADMLRGVKGSWGRWLFWAKHQPWYDGSAPIHVLMTPPRVEKYVAHLITCGDAPATIRHRVMGLERMMAALAPEHDRDWLKAIKSHFPKTGDRAKKRARIQLADDLIRFASALAEPAEELAIVDPAKGLRLIRVAVHIMWLAYRPMRLKNFRMLQIGVDLKCEAGEWKLDVPAGATKRGNAFDPVLPPRLVALLQRYLSHRLATTRRAPDDGPLWLNADGTHQSDRLINYYICKVTKKEWLFGFFSG
jgi:hypothetical protein